MNVFLGLFLLMIAFLATTPVSAHNFNIESLDENTAIGYESTDVALDSRELSGICYRDSQLRALKFAYDDGAQWIVETVDDGQGTGNDVGCYCAAIFDLNDRPHVLYLDSTAQTLLHAVKINGVWQRRVVDGGVAVDILATQRLSAAVSGDGHIGVAYYDAAPRDLAFAEFNGQDWIVGTLVSDGDAGRGASLAYDSQNRPAVAYQVKVDDTHARLFYIHYENGAWTVPELVEGEGYPGTFTSLQFDVNDAPHLAYHHIDVGSIQHQVYINRTGGVWQNQRILDSGSAPFVAVGRYCRLEVGFRGNAHILYQYNFASALFGRSYYLKLASLYFVDQSDREMIEESKQNIALSPWGTFYSGMSMSLDQHDNLLLSWAEGGVGDASHLTTAALTNWSPAIHMTTPNAENNDATEEFTARWLDFDPDSDARITFHYMDADFNTFEFGEPVSEDGQDLAILDVAGLARGNISIHARISDDGFQSYYADGTSDVLRLLEEQSQNEQQPIAQNADVQNENVQNQGADGDQSDDQGVDGAVEPIQHEQEASPNDDAQNDSGDDDSVDITADAPSEEETQESSDKDAGALQAGSLLDALKVAGCSLSAGSANTDATGIILVTLVIVAGMFFARSLTI